MVNRQHVEALRRLVKTTREGCELALRFPPAASEHRNKLEEARRALVDDCALVEELAAIVSDMLAPAQPFKLYPMLDEHDGRTMVCHRAVFTFREKQTRCAVDSRDHAAPWIGSPDPVLSVCEVARADGQDRVTRNALYTLTGIQLEDLYAQGTLKIGSATIRFVNDWPDDS